MQAKKIAWYEVDKVGIAHEDERRSITAPFNGNFIAQQIKILSIKQDSILGNHYHHYRELFYIVKGRAIFYLENVVDGERAIIKLESGDRLILDAKVAHKVKMTKDTFTVEATEWPYTSPERNDVRHEIVWTNI